MSHYVKNTDLQLNRDSEIAVFTDGSYHVHGSYYVYHWITAMILVVRATR